MTAHDDAGSAIDAERLRLLCRQTVRAPIGVLVAAGFVAAIMAPHVGAPAAWGWAAAAIGLWTLRAAVAARLLVKPPPAHRTPRWIQLMVAAATLSGAVAGASVVVFSGAPPLEWVLMTMVLCAWSAGGVAVSAAVPAAFYGLVTLFLTPLALGWLASDLPLRLPVAAMIVFFLFYLIVYARDGAALVARALRVGFENEELARQLRSSEAEARAARQRAEEANRAKSRFLAAASHDLRQPLHSLTLLLDHAVRTSEEPKIAQTLRQAARSAESLHELFTGLLDLSRLDAGSLAPEVKPLSLNKVLERIDNDYRPLAQGKGLAFECGHSTAWVSSDAVMLDRILRNLLDNAVKYTDAGRIALQIDEPGADVRIVVRDSGIGIDAADRERIFEEYYQSRNPARDRAHGIGLGLAIVKRLCDLLGHRIQVESEPGHGSVFTVVLPRAEPPATAADDDGIGAPPSHDALRGRLVVVIEDAPDVIDAMRTVLSDWGCDIVVDADAAGAIAQLRDRGRRPDAIVADWRLGGSENGLQAIERLHAQFGSVHAALVTGEIDAAAIDVPVHMAVALMRKPLRSSDLRDWLLQRA
ncbi:MAG TPA: ATP-binding protein [Burkholderiaceae bacterium]|nr:ATP-binding protein [Burkholderiaceae bacterium]